MERKTRSGKTPAASTPPGKRGRKKKSDVGSSAEIIPPARRSTRGRSSIQLLSETSDSVDIKTGDVLQLQEDPDQINEETSTVDVNQSFAVDVPEPLELASNPDRGNSLDPLVVQMLMTSDNGSTRPDESFNVEPELQDEDRDGSTKESQVVEPLQTLEQQMGEVILHERLNQITIQEDSEMADKNYDKQQVCDVEMEASNHDESTTHKLCENVPEVGKQCPSDGFEQQVASSEVALESSFDFVDIEDDAPFVRRSRRLQSIHLDSAPIKTEPNSISSNEIPKETAPLSGENQFSNSELCATEPIQIDLKQEEATKSREIMITVDQSDERLKRFEIIRDNIFLKKSDKKVCKVNKTMKCDCTITEEEVKRGELGCQFNCINRLLYIECGQKCRCGEYCDNQQFQRYNYSECSVFDTKIKGFGIRANHDIPAETFIIEYVGEVLDNKQFEKRAKKYSENKNIHYYFMALKSNAIIDATKKGNISRFINHSCDPNAETQKWTVNGELRVGFFSRKDIKAFDEITFDYQYQRYGKEAQKCYCDASNCRGWIGENPIDEDEEDNVESPEIDDTKLKKTKTRKARKPKAPLDKSQPELEVKDESDSEEDAKKSLKKREAAEKLANRLKKRQEIFDDLEIEGEINDLTESGLKNRAHTIRLSRLVVRAKNAVARSRLLKILVTGDLPCCRLFLDYNGLKLLYQWMFDLNIKSSIADLELAIEMMKAFEILPITNKTVLRTSKVLDRVEKWKNLDLEKKKMTKEERKQLKAEKKKNKISDKTSDQDTIKAENSGLLSADEQKENIETTQAPDDNAVDELTAVKIRVKQVASELLEKWEELKEDFKIPKKQKQEIMIEHEREADDWEDDTTVSRGDALSSDRYKNRFGDDPSQSVTSRNFQAPYKKDPVVSKHQRRQQFEMKVAQKDTEKRMTMLHDNNCQIFGLNPIITHPLDVPVRVNRVTGEYNTIDGRVAPPPPNHHQFKYEPLTLSTNPDDYHLPPIDLPENWQFALDEYGRIYYYHEKIRQSQWEAPIKILPLKIDTHSEEDSPESDESTTETEDSEEEELKALLDMLKRKKALPPIHHSSANNPLILPGIDGDEDDLEMKIMSNMMQNPVEQPLKLSQLPQKRMKKKRHGLTSMQFIRPRTEADKIYGRAESKRYKEVKEKLRQKKRRILKGEAEPGDETSEDDDVTLDETIGTRKFVDELDILELNKHKKEAEKKSKKLKTVVDQAEAKRQFRDEMIREITKFLQPFREDSCENGKITNEVDFTSLVNKLTFSVLSKETKHCQQNSSILKATDSVKAKTKEYIKKYMGKFDGPYQRKEDEQDYAIILNKF